MFCEKLPLWFTISSESCVFPQDFLCLLKSYHVWQFIVWKWGFKAALDDVRFIPKPNFNVENLSFIVFGTIACVYMPVYVYVCLKHAFVELEHACIYACPRVSIAFYFPKIAYLIHKIVIFSKNTFLKSISI